jgi:hypothetical protein
VISYAMEQMETCTSCDKDYNTRKIYTFNDMVKALTEQYVPMDNFCAFKSTC